MIFPRSTTTICAAVAPPATKFLAKQSQFLRETRCKLRHIKFWHGCIVRLSRGSGSSKKFLGGRQLKKESFPTRPKPARPSTRKHPRNYRRPSTNLHCPHSYPHLGTI